MELPECPPRHMPRAWLLNSFDLDSEIATRNDLRTGSQIRFECDGEKGDYVIESVKPSADGRYVTINVVKTDNPDMAP